MIRRTIFFTGRVQGVGFRWTTARIGKRHDVAGTVQNLADGRVKLVVEASRPILDEFLRDLREAMAGHIQSEDAHDSDPSHDLGESITIIR